MIVCNRKYNYLEKNNEFKVNYRERIKGYIVLCKINIKIF